MWTILEGDCVERLGGLESGTVQCCVTSPPYWQLRDYGVSGQLGCESSPEEYAASLVRVFREVRRVLRGDGVLWLNIGDSYCGGGGYSPGSPSNLAGSKQSTNRGVKCGRRPVPVGYKKKDLAGVPWQAALALRSDGWYLRGDVIWEKPNGIPERVRDRPTRTHEYVFLFSKSARYYYDAGSVEEEGREGARNRRSIWRIPQRSFPGAHFAVFPEDLVEVCVRAGSREGDTVLDPFAGTGTTGVVSCRLGRDFVGIELNGNFCEMAKERLTGQEGVV